MVADRLGFADMFGFSTAFKRDHGISPSEYRLRDHVPSRGTGTP